MLNSDYGQVQKLVEEAVRQLSAAAASSTITPLDKCQLMEQMNDNHVSLLLPRLRACDDQVAAFTQRCLDDKVRPLFPLICRSCPSSYAPFPCCSADDACQGMLPFLADLQISPVEKSTRIMPCTGNCE